MPMNFLSKLLFPRLAPWQRKRQIKMMLWVVLATVLFAASIAAIMLLQNSRK
jgi:hypothetical protein